MAWYGKDGKQYSTFNDKIRADDAWDEQRAEQARQNSLLNEQNRLLREQAEKERINKEKTEFERQEHEKEMRLLTICDSIGISKKIYDDFIEYLIHCEQQEKIDSIKNEIAKIEKIENAAKTGDYMLISTDTSGYDDCYEKVETSEKLQDLEKQLNAEKGRNVNIASDSKDKKNNYKIKICISALLTLIALVISLNIKNEDIEMIFFILTFVFFGYSAYVLVKLLNDPNSKIKEIEKSIEKEKNRLSNVKEFNIEKLNQKKDIIKKELEEEKKLYCNKIKKKYDDFLEFRKQHYNRELEKFLIDMDLPKILEGYAIDFSSISSKTKISDGSIEDYIDYFLSIK